MRSRVYFIPVKDSGDPVSTVRKIKILLEESRILDIVKNGYKVAVKMHFGEEGNTGFVRPEYAKVVCDGVTAKGATPVLSDTNTLYKGRRTSSKDHIKLAGEHGFTKKSTGADVVIPDEHIKGSIVELKAPGRFVKTAKVARFFVESDAIIAISHFKGHMMSGFGGAIKNIGMGCATRDGKLAQHCDISPVVYKDRCTGCGACVKICPEGAVKLINKKSGIDVSRCIGCAQCIAVCPTSAMFINFGVGREMQEKMAEYAATLLKEKRALAAFLNFAVKINKECDCWGMENPSIAPDVGILASLDPVAIDKASFDLVKKACGRDIFAEAHPDQNAMVQLNCARDFGLGSLEYELVELK